MRELSKKLLGIMLAITMVVATMSPLQGLAANGEAGKDLSAEALDSQSAGTGSDVTQDDGTAGDVTQDDGDVTQDDGEEEVPSYDINMPVIESFEFAENGRELKVSDTLHFTMSAYDADSGISSIYVYVSCDGNGNGGYVSFEKSEEGNLYTGTLPCSELSGSEFRVSEIRVEDKAGNYVTWDTWDSESGQSLYTFTLDYQSVIEEQKVFVSNFRMHAEASNEDGKLRTGDTVTFMADVRCDDEKITGVDSRLDGYAGNIGRSEYLDVSYDEAAQKLTGTFTVTDETYPTEWHWEYVYVSTESGKSYFFHPLSLEPDADVKFEVVQEDFDTEPPVIESISVDKNGQFVRAGDVVTLTVKVREEHPGYAYAYFTPQVTNVSVSIGYVAMEYNTVMSAYIGSVTITEDMYPCEWALTELYIEDEKRNVANLYEFQNDWNETLPWYFNVKPGNTFREDTKKVTFDFYGFAEQGDGSYQADALICSQTVENVGRRTSLKELGVTFPQPAEGVTAEWRRGGPWWDVGASVDENTVLLFNSASDMTYTFSATYDKVCANVSLTYMAKDSGQKTVMIPLFVDKGATYKKVLDALTLPEDAETEAFGGSFELLYSDDYFNENTQVDGKSCYLDAQPKYKDCQVAWNLRYMGQDGKEKSEVINKSYLKGTKLDDALADLEKPEDAAGAEFEAWFLESPGVGEISQSMQRLDVVAVYRGKTTVDAVYTYRGEEGEIISESGMVLMDGENLTDAQIQGEASEAFKDVKHYEGLGLSEWTSVIGVNQPRYKTVEFRALYHNCVLIFKYPGGAIQYAVQDKGAQYTLPTEYGTYKDIVWEGFAQGETVTVQEDREFIVKDYKLQGGEQEGPQGVRLPDDEIAKITEKIETAEEGDTITIDMLKATVVPKEVLEAIKGKSIEIVLDMGDYSWTIGGTDVLATKLRDIDLEVKVGTNTVPSGIVSSLAGDKPTTQLSLTHNGDFGFRADLTVNLGSENSGGTGNLYYYDSAGKLIFMNSGKIGEDGSTTLSFSHASDYVIVIEKADAPDDSKEDGTEGSGGDNENGDGKEDGTEENGGDEEDGNGGDEEDGNGGDEEGGSKPKDDGKKDGKGQTADIEKRDSRVTTEPAGVRTDVPYRKSPKTGEY